MTSATYLPLLSSILFIDNGLHFIPVLHQHHRKIFVRELAHSEGEVVGPGDSAAKQASFGLKIASDVDIDGVKGHRHLGATLHAVGTRNRESRAQLHIIRQASESLGTACMAHTKQANQKACWEQHHVCRKTT